MVRRNIIIFTALVVGTCYLYYETFITNKIEIKDDLPDKTTLRDNYWTLPKFRTRKLFSIQSGQKVLSNSVLKDRGITEHSGNEFPVLYQENFKRSERKKRETPKSSKLYKWNINLNVSRRNNSENLKIEHDSSNRTPDESLGMAISLQGNGNEESYVELFNAWNSVQKLLENIFGGNVQEVAEAGHGVTLDVNRFPNKTQLHGETKKSENETVEQSMETKGREPKFIFSLFESGAKSQDLPSESEDISTSIEPFTNGVEGNPGVSNNTTAIENVETSTWEVETSTIIDFSLSESPSMKTSKSTEGAKVTTDTDSPFASTTEERATVTDDSLDLQQLHDYCVWLLNNKKSSRSLDYDEFSGSGGFSIEENSQGVNTELPEFSTQSPTSESGSQGVIVSLWNRLIGKSENKSIKNPVPITEKPNLKSGSRFFNFNVFGLGSGLGRSAETGEEETIIFDSNNLNGESKIPTTADCEEFIRNLQLESTFSKPNLSDFFSHLLTNSTNLPLRINKSEEISESTLAFDASPDFSSENTKKVSSTIISLNQSSVTEDRPESRFFGIIRTTPVPFVSSTNLPTTVQKNDHITPLQMNPETLNVTTQVESTSQVNENTLAEINIPVKVVSTTTHKYTLQLEGSGDTEFFKESLRVNESIVFNITDVEATSSLDELMVTENIVNEMNFEKNESVKDAIAESEVSLGFFDGSGVKELTTENEDGRLFLGQIIEGSGSFNFIFGSGRGIEESEPTLTSDDSRFFFNFIVPGSGELELGDISEINEEQDIESNGSISLIFGSGLQGNEVSTKTEFEPTDGNPTSKEHEINSLTSKLQLQSTTTHSILSSNTTRKDLSIETSSLSDIVHLPINISLNKNKTQNDILNNCIDCNETREVLIEVTPSIMSNSSSFQGENKNTTSTENNSIGFEGRFMNALFSENTTGEIHLINEIEPSVSPEKKQTLEMSINSPVSFSVTSTSTTPKPVSMPIATTTILSTSSLISKRKRARFHDEPNFQTFTTKRKETSSLKDLSQMTNPMTTQTLPIFTTSREEIVPSSEYITETTKFLTAVHSETMSSSVNQEHQSSTSKGFKEVTPNSITLRTSSFVESTPSTLKETTRKEDFPTSSWSPSSTQSSAPRKKFCSSAMQCNHTLNERCYTSGNYKICGCAKSFVRHPETRKCEKPVELTTSLKLPGEKFHQDLKNPNSQRYKAMRIASTDAMKKLLQNDRAILSRITKIEVLGFEEGSLVVHWNIVLAADSNETVPDLVAQIDQDIQQAFRDPNVLKDLPLNVQDAQVLNIVSPANPCLDADLNYCSKYAECVSDSEKGFRCVCLPGFQDDSANPDYLGEVCVATCPPRFCGYHGECEIKENEKHCLCNGWYFGNRCQISGVVAVASFSAVNVIVVVLVICLICFCKKHRHRQSRYYGANRAQMESGISPQLGGEVALTEGTSTKARRYMAISTPLPQPIIQITSPSFPGSSISYDDSTFDRTPSLTGEPTTSVQATCEIMSRV